MDQYRFLLEELGIVDHEIPPDDIVEEETIIEEWGYPMEYRDRLDLDVEEALMWEEPEFHLDYDQEIHHSMNYKKKHRYSRKDRFRHTLYQLLGMSGETPKWLTKLVKSELGKRVKKQKIWNEIRIILKRHKLRRYYNRIPSLIKNVSGLKPMGTNSEKVSLILKTFFLFDYNFDNQLRSKWSRQYFPNLRFIALKLVAESGIKYPYHVPLIRTSRKKKYLEILYNDFKVSCCV
jgi:hypothetical protein